MTKGIVVFEGTSAAGIQGQFEAWLAGQEGAVRIAHTAQSESSDGTATHITLSVILSQ